MTTNPAQAIRLNLGISTETLADRLALQPQTLRAAICRHGHYFGIRPAKLPNGRLLWPADTVERLLTPGQHEGASDAAA